MKYIFLSLILFLTACSLDKNSAYLNEAPIKNTNFNTMTFEEFNLFLKDYSNNASYPDITN